MDTNHQRDLLPYLIPVFATYKCVKVPMQGGGIFAESTMPEGSTATGAQEGVDVQQPASADEHSQVPQSQQAGLVGTCNCHHALLCILIWHTSVLYWSWLDGLAAARNVVS